MPLYPENSSTPPESFEREVVSTELLAKGWTRVTLACGHVSEVLDYVAQPTKYCVWCVSEVLKTLPYAKNPGVHPVEPEGGG